MFGVVISEHDSGGIVRVVPGRAKPRRKLRRSSRRGVMFACKQGSEEEKNRVGYCLGAEEPQQELPVLTPRVMAPVLSIIYSGDGGAEVCG